MLEKGRVNSTLLQWNKSKLPFVFFEKNFIKWILEQIGIFFTKG